MKQVLKYKTTNLWKNNKKIKNNKDKYKSTNKFI